MQENKDLGPLSLDSQLCFALYAASRAITKTYRERLTPAGVTYPQYLVLIVLWETDGATISEIGRKLHLDSGTLTPMMKRLEVDGIVERRRGTRDEREVEVWLTEKGRSLKEIGAHARELVVERLDMSNEEIRALRSELMDVTSRLNSALNDQAKKSA